MIPVSYKGGARIPKFHSWLIYHIFHMSCPSEIITFCSDLACLPVNFKDFFLLKYLICKDLKGEKNLPLRKRTHLPPCDILFRF